MKRERVILEKVRKIQIFRSRTNIPQQINFICLTKGPHGTIHFCLAGQVFRPVAGKAILTLGGRCRVESRPDFGVYSSVHVQSCVALNCIPRWRSWTYMDKPRQSDSFAGHVEEHIAGIAFGSVGAPLYRHERRGRKQQQQAWRRE